MFFVTREVIPTDPMRSWCIRKLAFFASRCEKIEHLPLRKCIHLNKLDISVILSASLLFPAISLCAALASFPLQRGHGPFSLPLHQRNDHFYFLSKYFEMLFRIFMTIRNGDILQKNELKERVFVVKDLFWNSVEHFSKDLLKFMVFVYETEIRARRVLLD